METRASIGLFRRSDSNLNRASRTASLVRCTLFAYEMTVRTSSAGNVCLLADVPALEDDRVNDRAGRSLFDCLHA